MPWNGSLSIADLQDAYARGETTPTEVVRIVSERIAAYAKIDPAVWIDLVSLADLLRRAEELQTQYAGQAKPRLFGLPISVKNNIDVAGLQTTVGCPSFAYVPAETAPVVQRCLDEGAIIMGTTNLEQFATGLTGCRSPYGYPRSVFDPDYISGGSSSGSAVSVAANLVTFSIGSDTAGSIRLPAVFNGLVGMKPTLYTLSTRGVVPASKTADCISVLAKTVQDARTALGVMRWYDDADTLARPWSTFDQLEPWGQRRLRFGTPPRELIDQLGGAYGRLWKEVLESLQAEKSPLVPASFDYGPFRRANDLMYGSSFVVQRLVSFDDYLREHGTSKLHPSVASIFAASKGFDAVRAYQDQFKQLEYKRLVEREFRDHLDVLIVPTTVGHWTVQQVEADPLVRNQQLGLFSMFVNLVDLCAIAVPTGAYTNENGKEMPFGVTLIAPAGRDEELLDLAERLRSILPPAPSIQPSRKPVAQVGGA